MDIEELIQYHACARKKAFIQGKRMTGISFRKKLHPLVLTILKVDQILSKEKIVIISDKHHTDSTHPRIYACTHIGGNDIQRTFQVIKEPAYLMLGDPGILYKMPIYQGLRMNGVIPLETADRDDRKIAYSRAVELLESGGNLLIYPEGAWNVTENLVVMKIFNLKQFVEAYNYIMENRLFTVETLTERVEFISSQVVALKAELDASDKRRKELKDLLQQAENYARLKPIFDEMNGIRWKGQREKYRQEHERELRQFYMVRRKLKDAFTPDGKLPISAWRQEMERLAREHEAAYARYKPLRDDLTKLLQVRHHVNVALEQRGLPMIERQRQNDKRER